MKILCWFIVAAAAGILIACSRAVSQNWSFLNCSDSAGRDDLEAEYIFGIHIVCRKIECELG